MNRTWWWDAELLLHQLASTYLELPHSLDFSSPFKAKNQLSNGLYLILFIGQGSTVYIYNIYWVRLKTLPSVCFLLNQYIFYLTLWCVNYV